VIASSTDGALALARAAFVVAMFTHDYENALRAVDRALALNSNSALAFGFIAMTESNAGRYDEAIGHGKRAIHLSPLDPMNCHPYLGIGFACFFNGNGDEAAVAASHAIQINPSFIISHALLAASYAQLDRMDAARSATGRLLDLAPGFAATMAATMIEEYEFTAPEKVAQFAATLRKAGLRD
jgi:adenylate cyclase